MSDDENKTLEDLIAEVKQIRELLTPPPEPKPPEKPKGIKNRAKAFGSDFLDFIKKYKVVGLAVAFIMAMYVTALVNSVVNDLIFAALGDIPFIKDFVTNDPTASWMDWPFKSSIRLGAFFSSLITFIIVAFIVFLIVKLTKKIGLE